MKCLFIMPPWTFKDTHMQELQEDVAGVTAPTGILYLASMVRQKGHEPFVIDGAFNSQEKIIEKFGEINPEFVGVSIVSMLWENAKSLMREIKKAKPGAFIVIGGPHPNSEMEKLFSESPDFDALVYGDGEYTIQEIAEKISKTQPLDGVKGIIFRKGKTLKKNPPREMIKDLDALPYPAFDLIDLHKYRPSVGHYRKLPIGEIVTGRGCPFNCLYCSKIHGNKVQSRDPVKVVDELEYYIKTYGIKEAKVWNELFTFDRNFVMKFCDEILRRKLDIAWSATARVDTIDEALLRKMKSAGCWYLQFGIESGVQKNLNALRKGTNVENVEKAIKLTQKSGIKCFATYILGIPDETYDEALQTIEFACKLNTFYAEFFPLTPLPGTDLYNHVERYGKMLGDTTKLTMHHISFVPYTMTVEQLDYLRTYAFKRYYSRPAYIVMRLLSIRSLQDLEISWRGFSALLKIRASSKKPA